MDTLVITENITVTTVIVSEQHTVFVVEDKPSVLVVPAETVVVSEVPVPSPTALLTTNEVVTTLVIKEIGPQGPPGTTNFVDIDRMLNPNYPISRRIPILDTDGILVGIDVYSEKTSGSLLFERIIDYDPVSGDVLSVQTDDVINNKRLIKTMIYDNDSNLIDIQREMVSL